MSNATVIVRRGWVLATLALVCLLAAGQSARAQWVWDNSDDLWHDQINNAITSPTVDLADLVGTTGSSLQVGDKTFTFPTNPSTFVVTGPDTATALLIRDSIKVTGYYYPGSNSPGLLFSSTMLEVNSSTGPLDVTFEFDVTAPGPYIIAANMVIPQGGTTVVEGSVINDDVVTITENVSAGGDPLAGLLVGIPEIELGDDDLLSYDIGPFPAEQTIHVQKNILLTPGQADGGSIELNYFAQTFTQVPEPGTLALAAAGLGLMAARRRRR